MLSEACEEEAAAPSVPLAVIAWFFAFSKTIRRRFKRPSEFAAQTLGAVRIVLL
jgi:hypothetical protein